MPVSITIKLDAALKEELRAAMAASTDLDFLDVTDTLHQIIKKAFPKHYERSTRQELYMDFSKVKYYLD